MEMEDLADIPSSTTSIFPSSNEPLIALNLLLFSLFRLCPPYFFTFYFSVGFSSPIFFPRKSEITQEENGLKVQPRKTVHNRMKSDNNIVLYVAKVI